MTLRKYININVKQTATGLSQTVGHNKKKMKVETLLLIITIGFVFVGIIGLVLWAQEDKPRLSKAGVRIGKFSLYWILLMAFFYQYGPIKQNYSLMSEQDFWTKYDLPQIDSTMILEYSARNMDSYLSWSDDSVLHLRKIVERDVFDVYSVTDSFVNRKLKLRLSVEFIKPNIIRDSSRIYTIETYGNYSQAQTDTISRTEFNSYLYDWGLSNKVYNVFNLHKR